MSLAHPNIAKVFEADCVDGECFIACEFARGINVKERVRRAGPIAAPLAVDIMIPVLTALELCPLDGNCAWRSGGSGRYSQPGWRGQGD